MRALILILGFLAAKAAFADTVIHGIEPEGGPGMQAKAVEYHTGLIKLPQAFRGLGETAVSITDCPPPPAAFELPAEVIPTVKDQKSCGSCWAFSKTGAFETWLAATGKSKGKTDLAEQELVSDDRNNYGCDGGNLQQGREYQMTHGQGKEADFPYTARDSAAKQIPPVAKAPDYVIVPGSGAAKVLQIQCALQKYHTSPWITVGADNDWGSPPTADGAVWTRCSNNGTNHAIGVTGWKTVNGKVYFHAKNSWGTGWGQSGYAWIPLGCDGFGEEVAFLPAETGPCEVPKPLLPVEVYAHLGDSIELAVHKVDGVAYDWWVSGKLLDSGATLPFTVSDPETIVTVKAKNACGSGESSVRVKSI